MGSRPVPKPVNVARSFARRIAVCRRREIPWPPVMYQSAAYRAMRERAEKGPLFSVEVRRA
jgi:hypothetical protein